MKICTKCDVANEDYNRTCRNCGQALPLVPSIVDQLDKVHELYAIRRSVDIMFALDCTASMAETIDVIKDTILTFADTIANNGMRAKVGLVEFHDQQGDQRVPNFEDGPLTDRPVMFRREVAALCTSSGSKERRSNSLAAVRSAADQLKGRENASAIVLIADSPPLEDSEQAIEETLQTLDKCGIEQIYLIIRTSDLDSRVYLRLIEGRRGLAFNLDSSGDLRKRIAHFRKTLESLGSTISATTR